MFDFLYFSKDKEYKVDPPSQEIEPQEVLLDTLAQERTQEGLRGIKLEVPLSEKILKGGYVFFLLIVAVFGLKTIAFQVFNGDEFALAAKKNLNRDTYLAPPRGVIYDRNFNQLVFNEPSFDVVCDKRDMPSSRSFLEEELGSFSRILSRSFEELKREFDANPYPEILIGENVSHDQLVILNARLDEFPGCTIRLNEIRNYDTGLLASHLLGYTAKISKEELSSRLLYSVADQIGKEGVERQYEEFLRGTPGKISVQTDAFGQIVAETKKSEPIAGSGVVLWMERGLQTKLFEGIERVFRDTGAKKAAAVALDPQTGGVLALVSLPSFDPTAFSGGISQKEWDKILQNPLSPLFNRVIGGVGYPTGSVIKPLIGLAALEEGVINETTTLFAPLELCVENVYTKQQECFHDWTFHGNTDIKRAIAESVNPFFYMLGGGYENFRGLGSQKIKQYLEKFGWNEPTGIDIPGEGKGILPTIDKNWRLGDTYHFSIGQGPFAVTPLQVATAISAIANGGKLMEPHVVKSIVDSEKNPVQEFQPQVKSENFVDPANVEIIKKGMRQTVTAGSATGFLDRIPVKVAAKTGTAQTGRKTWNGKDYLYSWTVAFAPYEDPEIVLVVVVEDIVEGRVAALPVVRDAFQWYFSR
ncbi:MAG: penicillin-binding protein 2 [Candidatus Wildermuthbacteria bacterium]|nr:penicillin-binding protein 2 [Candidatus Wildermuthbacteria bacterium]